MILVGLMVGGRATRFGGVAKGMLPAPDTGEPLALRLARICREALGDADVVLVGSATAYDALALPSLEDCPAGVGPLGGLAALLAEAQTRGSEALAVAADFPYVTASLVARLRNHASLAPAVAPRPGGVWQPLFARYSPGECIPVLRAALDARRFAARAILEGLAARAVELPLDATEAPQLDDWDAPEDMTRTRG
jgi:molybdopterin-guanine dinucleotide biosynthesis protein A